MNIGCLLDSVSRNAGGYVCERTYHALLSSSSSRAIPSFFLHVPPAAALSSARQTRIVRSMLEHLAPQLLTETGSAKRPASTRRSIATRKAR